MELLESLLFEPLQGYFLLERHLARLRRSAAAFAYPFEEAAAREVLWSTSKPLREARKVRLLLSATGELSCEHQPLKPSTSVRAALSRLPIQIDQRVLHKTTDRTPYTACLASVAMLMVDDVLLWNERGELTETSTANLVVELGGRKYTPALSSGLLAGTFREALLADGEIEEAVLRKDDLHRADALWLINSVRRWCKINWLDAGNS